MKRQMFTGIVVVALVAALGCAGLGWTLYRSEQAMLKWPVVAGRIIASEIALQPLDTVSIRATSATHMYWEVLVRYEYEVGGKRYAGRQLSNNPPRVKEGEFDLGPPDELTPYLKRYVAGSAVNVRHHATRPERSTLEVSTSGSRSFAIATVAALLVALAAAALLSKVGGAQP